MISVINGFGNAPMLTGEELEAKSILCYCIPATIHTEVLGWCNANKSQVVLDPGEADTILILEAAKLLTHLVLNDILTARAL